MITPIFSTVELVEVLWQLDDCLPFIVVFTFSDMVVKFPFPLLRSQVTYLLAGSLSNATLFMF